MSQIIKNYYIQKQHTCRNCGEGGHLYKSCPKPIMSFGIICYRINNNNIEYLMIQRRDSLSFMEFIRGKYQLDNIEYIKRLLTNMTAFERELLLIDKFEDLWNKVWYQPAMPKQTQEFIDARDKFMALKQGYHVNSQIHVNLYKLLYNLETKYTEPEWGFPKGRRRLKEKDIDCAVREFNEETGFHKNEVCILDNFDSYEEIFYGTNDIQYRHVYYLATITTDAFRIIVIDPNNPQQAREVSQVKWFTADEVLKRIRDHNIERKELFANVHCKLQQHLLELKGLS
jgi:8-oxo-dGTP pyrophosphatase MutT (NUDIX family)